MNHLCERLRRWAPLVQLLSIQPPSDAVEFDIGLGDLALEIDSQEIRSLHSILPASDVREQPVPRDLVAAVKDLESLDVGVRMGRDFAEPLRFGRGRWSVSELENQLAAALRNRYFDVI